MNRRNLPVNEVTSRGRKARIRELGTAGMARLIEQVGKGHGDYTKDRHRIVGNPTLDETVVEIEKFQKHSRR